MKITNNNGELFGVFCGGKHGTEIFVTGDYALLTFHSDIEEQRPGFNISFTVIPNPGEYNQNNISQ